MTNRQFETWQEWLRQDMNRPSRADHYVMRLTREVTLPHLREGVSPSELSEYVLKFGLKQVETPKPEELAKTDGPPIMTEETILAAQKQMAIAKMGGGVKYEQRWVNRRGEPIPPPPGKE